jgi:predicted metal-dependent hydrolase
MRRISTKSRSDVLEYSIIHRPRVTKRLHMELDQHGGLVVVAPAHWSKRYIRSTLAKNIPRVERFLANAREKQLTPLRYVNGEQHFYLGESYPLAIHQMTAGKTHVALVDGEIRIHTSKSQPENIQSSLQNWYLQIAAEIFSERLTNIARRAPWARDKTIPLKLRRMKRTWGNCSSRGVIKLNTHLVKAPLAMIDSVIAHEICHLEEMNHSKAFYALLEKLNPDWRLDRARLRAGGFVYLLR